MATIKKKDLKKYKAKSKKEDIAELVDADGSPIGDDEGSDRNPSTGEIETSPQGTSDDHAAAAIQPNRYYYGIAGSSYSHGNVVRGEGEEDIVEGELTETEIAEAKMTSMLEDLVGGNNQQGMVTKYKDTDVNRNQIPDLEELARTHNKPVVAKKAEEVLKTMEMNNLNGEEIGIVINYLLTNIDLEEVPNDYKRILRKQL